ncbi:Shedu anti-phage system protein SduA domain-containing protein [Echinicola sp. 20G]|uniref:Shedu anti-phage system protein SduA domain-containing protein n=1 Tax=Echinicola sp. 20G TaxID=2781961 RepID=UPI00190FF00F|nr:Shedu anti-phage system protein SduA domain-containing protein [Echinicola sp. 20G]
MFNNKLYNWPSLKKENSIILNEVVENWKVLLNNNLPENDYHEFIKEHAGFFFSGFNCYLTLSKLKLGSEYETDFINIRDERSNGIIYEFIEIEKPSSKLFNKYGTPAKDFNNALQQIRDWKRFLIDNKSWLRKLLPSQTTRVLHDEGVCFTIIIGRRSDNHLEIEKRNQIASEMGIKIRSFDYLTDLIKKREFYPFACLDSEKGDFVENQMENPFYKAIGDSKWKEFCLKKFNWTHFYKNNCEQILEMREHNDLIKKWKFIGEK